MAELLTKWIDMAYQNENSIDWDIVSFALNPKYINRQFFKDFVHKINWDHVSNFSSIIEIPEDFLFEFADYIDWDIICYCQGLSEQLMDAYPDRIDWSMVGRNGQILTVEFIRKHIYELDWFNVSQHQILTDEMIREFDVYLDWLVVSTCQKISLAIAREYAHVLDWRPLCQYQVLSEELMIEFADYLDWNKVSKYQSLTEPFIDHFANKIVWEELNWEGVAKAGVLSLPFLHTFQTQLLPYREHVDAHLLVKHEKQTVDLILSIPNDVANIIKGYI